MIFYYHKNDGPMYEVAITHIKPIFKLVKMNPLSLQ
jgi:hypothetical protein